MERKKERMNMYKTVYLLRCFGRALSSTANILETNTMTGASSDDVQARKSEKKKT